MTGLRADYDPNIQQLIQKFTGDAETSINKTFSREIEELDQLLKDERLDMSKVDKLMVDCNVPVPFSNQQQANGTPQSNKRKRTNSETDNSGFQVEQLKGGTKVLVLPSGTVQSNHHIKELIELVKPKILHLIDIATKLRMWIVFLIPKIEDGNNFGVQIQEDVLEEIKAVEAEAATYIEHFSRYYLTRAKTVAKICKYPHVDDFRQVLREIDEKQILELRLAISEMKNQYLSVYDLLMKNYDKIKTPKNNNSSTMF